MELVNISMGAKPREIVLYQTFPGRDSSRFGLPELGNETIKIKTFCADKAGVAKAIEYADRPDAVLVRLDKHYFDAKSMIDAIQKKIKQKKFVRVFQPTYKMP